MIYLGSSGIPPDLWGPIIELWESIIIHVHLNQFMDVNSVIMVIHNSMLEL